MRSRSARASAALVVAVGVSALTATAAVQASAAGAPANGDVVRSWTTLALDTARATSANDATAARLYAMVDAAMYDAVNGLAPGGQRRTPAIVAGPPSSDGDPVVAAATAAHDVLVGLYPSRRSTYDTALAETIAAAGSPAQTAKGQDWGAQVAAAVLSARSGDGLAGTETQPGGSGPGVFTASWNAQPRHLAPFAIADPQQYVDAGPPAITSAEYTAAYNDVKAVGNAAIPDPMKQQTYDFWALGSGSDQPPGAWLQVAEQVSETRGLSLADTARLFALQSMAMADTVAATYQTKFVYRHWRPTTAIRTADDGNPATEQDPTWTSRAGSTGGSPQHYSGHSTFSAAGAAVLAGFFCADDIAFSLDTDDTKSLGARSYTSFTEAADEAGRSRVYGGQHFEFSNQAGLRAGRAIADEVLHSALLTKSGVGTGC